MSEFTTLKNTVRNNRRYYVVWATALLSAVLLTMLGACSQGDSSSTTSPTATTPQEGIVQSATASDPVQESKAADAQPAVLPTVTPTTVEPDAGDAGSMAPSVALEDLSVGIEPVVSGLDQPVFVTDAGDGSGRLFIVEQSGAIRIWQDNQLLDEPFLDIGELLRMGHSEQGLLGLAFEPNYAETGRFYVDYTDVDGNTVVARYTVGGADPNIADGDSAVPVLQIQQPAANHNGGMLAFEPDGYLYIGMGDGGASFDRYGNAQNAQTLLGSLLRIDVASAGDGAYVIPADNPWVEADLNGVDARDELWAIGLRNPWRFSFDRDTGDLWIADVGQNQYEEVNYTAGGAGGGNYGWPIQEGTHCVSEPCDTTGLIQPVLEYDHQGNCSITGGYVYRGERYPELNGFYFYADYCSGTIWAAPANGATVGWQSAPVVNSGMRISSFGQDEAGNVYVLDHGGTVYQLVTTD